MAGTRDFISGIVWGGLVGAAIGMLMAPRSGEETRALLRERSDEFKMQARETADNLREKATETAEQARGRASELAASASGGEKARLYGRTEVSASKTSAACRMRARSGMSSPRRPSG